MMITIICLSIIAAVFGTDLWIKNYVENKYEEGFVRSLCRGKVLIHILHNRGIALGIGQAKRGLVTVVSVCMTFVAAVCFVGSLGQRGNHILRIGLAFLLGGAFSNTYDRLARGYVVDYISFDVKWKRLQRIVFNLSDFCIMIGAAVSAIGEMR